MRNATIEPTADTSSRSRRSRLGKRVAALAIGFVLLEVAVMPFVGYRAPLRLRARLPAPMFVLGQSSKAGFLPRDYVLVLGDSYAEGYGDWLRTAIDEPGNPSFQATHVLHERSKRDVVTFGRGGASNVYATAYLVEKRFAALRRVGLGDPSEVLIYFYEGNDLHGNLRDAQRYHPFDGAVDDDIGQDELDEFLAHTARDGFWKGLAGTLFVPYTLWNIVKGPSSSLETHPIDVPLEPVAAVGSATAAESGPTALNVIRVGERHYYFDGPSEGPVLELDDDEIEMGVRVLAGCLRWTMRRFESVPIAVVYVPSPLTCYEISSPMVNVKTGAGPQVHPAAGVRPASRKIRSRVEELVVELGLPFIDATPALQEAGARDLVHGPRDGNHLNRDGYLVLADVIESARTKLR